jgi:nitric oxide reductase NorD protein
MASLALRLCRPHAAPERPVRPRVFTDTVIDYRDDNRQLWTIHRGGRRGRQLSTSRERRRGPDIQGLPPRRYPEWDAAAQELPARLGQRLRSAACQRRCRRTSTACWPKTRRWRASWSACSTMLKPQDKVRIRYQEEGSELDLDVALRSLIDWRAAPRPTRAST